MIPHVNDYSINIGKRFWPGDNTDINRMFPGNEEGETTKRIAAGLFEKVKGYSYGIQFPSFYMPGDFVPHVRMMEAGMESASLANLFGLPYVVMRVRVLMIRQPLIITGSSGTPMRFPFIQEPVTR